MGTESPLQWIELSRQAFNHNIDSLVRLASGKKVAVSVKANAYGHGLPQIVSLLAERNDVDYLSVHSLGEGIDCREAGWKRRIIVLGPIPDDCLDAVPEFDLEPTIFDIGTLKKLGAVSKRRKQKIQTHLKLETGTNRQGITIDELPKFANAYKSFEYIKKPYGASMHFANIEDTTAHEYADYQLKKFHKMTAMMTKLGIKPTIRHAAASAAMILFDKTRFDLVRPGIAAYGLWPSKETYLSYRLSGGENDLFWSVLSWKAKITQIKNLEADSFVGYGCSYRTTSKTKLAIIPVGYCDGYDRRLSNIAHLIIKGMRSPVRGRICMNLLMADITDIKGVKAGETAILIGQDKSEQVSIEQVADWSSTIHYEVAARLSSDLPRQVVE